MVFLVKKKKKRFTLEGWKKNTGIFTSAILHFCGRCRTVSVLPSQEGDAGGAAGHAEPLSWGSVPGRDTELAACSTGALPAPQDSLSLGFPVVPVGREALNFSTQQQVNVCRRAREAAGCAVNAHLKSPALWQ